MGNYIMLDFPFFQFRRGRRRMYACWRRQAWRGRVTFAQTGVTQRQLEWTGPPAVEASAFLFSSLLPQSWSRLKEFHRPDSEFWLFLFFLSTFCTKPFIEATGIVIDWFVWFSICFLLEWMSPEVLRIKLLRNKKQRVTAEPSCSSNQDLTMIGIFYFGSYVIFP